MKLVAGIDPGLNGAICLYDPTRLENGRPGHVWAMYDMPTLEITRNGKKRRQIDLYELARWVDKNAEHIGKAIIENPQGMPGQSSNSTHQLGLNCGIARMAIAAHFIPMELVSPQSWKKKMNLSKDKDSCRLRASQINPQAGQYWARVKDDGRAEAFLLAWYGANILT